MKIYESKPRKKRIYLEMDNGAIMKIKLYIHDGGRRTFDLGFFYSHTLSPPDLRDLANYLDKRNKKK